METFDYDLHNYLNEDDSEFECTECGEPVFEEGTQCSSSCFEASMR